MQDDVPDRAAELITLLGLQPHPEGGHYREVFRSANGVTPADGRGRRAAMTSIYFLLTGGEVSRWHRVTSDEAWHFYEGTGLELLRVGHRLKKVETIRLGRVGEDPWNNAIRPTATVPAGHWQAARPVGDDRLPGGWALVGCTVGPGFDFADFELMADAAEADEFRRVRPAFAFLI